MVKLIKEIEKRTDAAFKGINTITFENICRKLIKLVDPIEIILIPELSLVGLKIFRKIIEMENLNCEPSACSAEW